MNHMTHRTIIIKFYRVLKCGSFQDMPENASQSVAQTEWTRCRLEPIAMQPAFQEDVCLLDTMGHRRANSYRCVADGQNQIIAEGWRFLACYDTLYIVARNDSQVLVHGQKLDYSLSEPALSGCSNISGVHSLAQKTRD
jgi:hypothetical protein